MSESYGDRYSPAGQATTLSLAIEGPYVVCSNSAGTVYFRIPTVLVKAAVFQDRGSGEATLRVLGEGGTELGSVPSTWAWSEGAQDWILQRVVGLHPQDQPSDDVGHTIRFLQAESAYGVTLAEVLRRLSGEFGKPLDMIGWALAATNAGMPTNPQEIMGLFRRIETAGVVRHEERDGPSVRIQDGPGRYHMKPRKVLTWTLTDQGRKVLMRLYGENP